MSDLLYCKDCLTVSRSESCPLCGRKLHLPALEDDLCRLADLGPFESELLAQLLRNQDIPFHQQNTSGLVPVMGLWAESWRFFFHCANLEQAQEPLAALDAGAAPEWPEETGAPPPG